MKCPQEQEEEEQQHKWLIGTFAVGRRQLGNKSVSRYRKPNVLSDWFKGISYLGTIIATKVWSPVTAKVFLLEKERDRTEQKIVTHKGGIKAS